MPGEKKFWRLPTPFRGISGKQDPPLKAKVGHPGSRMSSVYLSGDSSTDGFVIVPEFDNPARTETTHEESNYISYLPNPPAVTCSDPLPPNSVDCYLCDFESTGSRYSSSLGGGSCDASVVNTWQVDEFTQRLGSAYEHIRSMPIAASPNVFSSDPQMLRKQLGVPQHSVLNYPISSAPDLPNPHTTPHEPTSPGLPLSTSPDVSHARTSKKIRLRIDTNVYPPSRNRFSDPLQPAQRRSMVTAPTPSQKPTFERSTLRKRWTAKFASASKLQSFISDPSKPAERRVDNPIISPSSMPSSRRQTLRGSSRKSAADTLPSKNAPGWQISLPQIRPPSPFRVDIPLHHTWHDRRTDFNFSPECHSKVVRLHESKLRRTSESTDILASLAWIGTSPVASSIYTTNRGRLPVGPRCLPDSLGMATAVEDDSISDDVLVDQLEKVRRIGDPSDRCRDTFPLRSSKKHFRDVEEDENELFHTFYPSPPSPQTSDQLFKPCDVLLPSSLMSKDTTSDSDDAAAWQAARKALLCVREIVRTEKKYQEALKMLLNAQTATPPPPSMAPYVSALVRASEMLLKCFFEDPSAWGVSTAFVTSEDELEATMVSWCAVAGGFFADGNDPQSGGMTRKWRLRKSGMMSRSSPLSMAKQTSNSFSPQLPPMFSIISTASKIKEQADEEYCAGKHPETEKERKTSLSLQNSESTGNRASSSQPPGRKLSVRDLAIQPIQRVMRYVLLYRDLLDCTPPTSPSRLLVECALEAATRIAEHCDRAQRNPAFCHDS